MACSDGPDRIETPPDFANDVPVAMEIEPDDPGADCVWRAALPLSPESLEPDSNSSRPPVCSERAAPARTTTLAAPETLDPATTLIDPAVPAVAAPVLMTASPEAPCVADPVDSDRLPLLSLLAVTTETSPDLPNRPDP